MYPWLPAPAAFVWLKLLLTKPLHPAVGAKLVENYPYRSRGYFSASLNPWLTVITVK